MTQGCHPRLYSLRSLSNHCTTGVNCTLYDLRTDLSAIFTLHSSIAPTHCKFPFDSTPPSPSAVTVSQVPHWGQRLPMPASLGQCSHSDDTLGPNHPHRIPLNVPRGVQTAPRSTDHGYYWVWRFGCVIEGGGERVTNTA